MLQVPPPNLTDSFRHQISRKVLVSVAELDGMAELHAAGWPSIYSLAAAAVTILVVISMIVRARHHWRLRVVAVACFMGAEGHMSSAVRAFKHYCEQNQVARRPKNMHQFIKDAMTSLNERGDLNPPKPKGRRCRLSMTDAMICAEQLMAGYYFSWTNEFGESVTEHKGYDSFAQACVENPVLAYYMQRLAYKKPCNFLRAIRRVYPDVIHKHPLDMKQKFTPAQAAYRVAQCLAVKALLAIAPNLLRRTCFMDAYHVKIKPGKCKGFGVYCSTQDRSQMEQ